MRDIAEQATLAGDERFDSASHRVEITREAADLVATAGHAAADSGLEPSFRQRICREPPAFHAPRIRRGVARHGGTRVGHLALALAGEVVDEHLVVLPGELKDFVLEDGQAFAEHG